MHARISYFEIEQLAAALLGKTEEYENDELEDDIDRLFYDEFDTELESLHKIVEKLVPMIDAGTTISGKMAKGFAQDGLFIVQVEV